VAASSRQTGCVKSPDPGDIFQHRLDGKSGLLKKATARIVRASRQIDERSRGIQYAS
jgi:hypothetical protein